MCTKEVDSKYNELLKVDTDILEKTSIPEVLLEEGLAKSLLYNEIPNSVISEETCKIFDDAKKFIDENNDLINEAVTVRKRMPEIEGLQDDLSNLSNLFPVISDAFVDSAAMLIKSIEESELDRIAPTIEEIITVPIMQWLNDVDSSPIIDAFENAIPRLPKGFDLEKFNTLYLSAMYEARWFPYLGWNADLSLARAVMNIIESTRKSRNRVRKIDKAAFNYYKKSEIEAIRKAWRRLLLPNFKLRILNQAVYAYHRKEYVLTVATLVSLWEGIIAQKMDLENDYRISGKTRANLTKLIERNDYDKIFSSYCEEFIFYDCRHPKDTKADVPGRHEIAHSWYDKYPSRKMALNAILFTDFLLNLNPVMNMEE